MFPGQQAAPLAHTITAKAVAFKIAATDEFRDAQRRTVEGARIIADRLMRSDVAGAGVRILSGGTDVHLLLVDLRDAGVTGKQLPAEALTGPDDDQAILLRDRVATLAGKYPVYEDELAEDD